VCARPQLTTLCACLSLGNPAVVFMINHTSDHALKIVALLPGSISFDNTTSKPHRMALAEEETVVGMTGEVVLVVLDSCDVEDHIAFDAARIRLSHQDLLSLRPFS